jgi:hypothetical protein
VGRLSESIDNFADLFDDADAARIWDMLHRPIFFMYSGDAFRHDESVNCASLLIHEFAEDNTVANDCLLQMAQIHPH